MPFRTCIGCRSTCSKEELIRLVISDGKLIVDWKGDSSGRGAYLHRRIACIRKAVDQKLINHRFRLKNCELDMTALSEWLAAEISDAGSSGRADS